LSRIKRHLKLVYRLSCCCSSITSTPAFSTPAGPCRYFHSRFLHSRILSAPVPSALEVFTTPRYSTFTYLLTYLRMRLVVIVLLTPPPTTFQWVRWGPLRQSRSPSLDHSDRPADWISDEFGRDSRPGGLNIPMTSMLMRCCCGDWRTTGITPRLLEPSTCTDSLARSSLTMN